MTTEGMRLEDQLRRAVEAGAWHGPAVLELPAGIAALMIFGHLVPSVRWTDAAAHTQYQR
jgi:metallophosphoesterase superfamily enzyme